MLLRRSALISVMLVAGCYYSLDTAPRECEVSTKAPACLEAPDHSDFAWIRDNVFKANCGGTDCHSPTNVGDKIKGDIDLSPDLAYQSLLGNGAVMSQVDDGRTLVVPGDPNNSYLLFMLNAVPKIYGDPPFEDPPSDVGYMPQKNKTLCCQKLDAVRRWIEAGAQP